MSTVAEAPRPVESKRTMPPTASLTGYALANAINLMVSRYGDAEQRAAHAFDSHLDNLNKPEVSARYLAEHARQVRAAGRRYAAIMRLVRALRDLEVSR